MTKAILDLQKGIPFNVHEDALLSAVILSLFCDARGFEADGSESRGWWADGLTEDDRWGSRLWELTRSKDISETFRLTEDYATAALNWLITDGIAKKIVIFAFSPHAAVLGLLIKIDNRTINLEIKR